jgi:ABC-2 type transport system ATP-binding protein
MTQENRNVIAIETRGLTRDFGKLTAVEFLNLQITSGALFGLIGPNGAGKTTTLRMLAGLLEPTAGQILISGQLANGNWREMQRQIGYMPDFFGVYEDMLVWEYLDFFARCHGMAAGRRQQVIADLLDLVDLAEKRNDYVQHLSRGMRQRLCLAHALVHDPEVLLLDEPASGLDPRARVEMRELLRELHAMGKTIVLSSHILTELAELCDTVGIIERGHLVASGSLDEIRQQVVETRTLRLRVLSDREQAIKILKGQTGVGEIYPSDGTLEVEFLGGEDATADLLANLVSAGVRLAAFSEELSDLEEIFLRLTKGEVA